MIFVLEISSVVQCCYWKSVVLVLWRCVCVIKWLMLLCDYVTMFGDWMRRSVVNGGCCDDDKLYEMEKGMMLLVQNV